MPDWLGYSLSDFLMFSPHSYFRLYELNNTNLWPLPLVMILAAGVLLLLSRRSDRQSRQISMILLTLTWSMIAWHFFYQLFTPINLAAPWFAIAFGIEALLLLLLGSSIHKTGQTGKTGLWLFIYALVIHPFIGLLAGRNWQGVELFGIAPDPTALGTLGLLLLLPGIKARLLAVIPFLWCLVSGVTYLAMELPYGLLTPIVAISAIIISLKKVPGNHAPGQGQ